MKKTVAAALAALADHWKRFRSSRVFLPAVITAPILAIASIGGGSYAAWDATRVDVPNAVGQHLPSGSATLRTVNLGVDEPSIPDAELARSCYVITSQSVSAGTRVVPEETRVTFEIEPDQKVVPRIVGDSFASAKKGLLASCLHEEVKQNWCIPTRFSGMNGALEGEALFRETGFEFDPGTGILKHASLVSEDSWIVCEQYESPSSELAAGSHVGLSLTAPLTTVPEIPDSTLSSTLESLAHTADGCVLHAKLSPTFVANPSAIHGMSLPSTVEMASWNVDSLAPAVGHALLCNAEVVVKVAWPVTTMPTLIGLHHAPESPASDTATTAALKAAGLKTTCSGKGTITNQVPAAGAEVPVGTKITCVAELVVPSVVGMDPAAAAAALTAAGVKGSCSGSGVVVSQSPLAGTVLTGTQEVSCEARAPQPVAPFYGGGGNGGGGDAYYKNCTAAREAGAAPILRGQPGYRPALDRDNDGVACE